MKAQSEGKKSVKMEAKDLKKDLDKVSKGKTPARTKNEVAKTAVKTDPRTDVVEKAFETPEVKKEPPTEQDVEEKNMIVDVEDNVALGESPEKNGVKDEKEIVKSNILLERFENICSE